ncbi:phage tail protein [Paenibacillus sp. GYB004]|uniref:phage tail-collar fiber domain-containing protein n=1 Tax=Paenibacillus sp. GYB004 TaxID=2994393 RepID=UPI002F962D65
MAGFGGLFLTNKGRALQAKAQAGVTLHYNRIGIGDGNLGGQSIPNLNNLISQKKSLPITKLQTLTGGKAVVGTVLTNQDVTTGFYFRELGVFAQDPDEGEILFCYGNAGANAEFIPAAGGQDVIEKTIDAVTIVGNAANVTATIDNSLIFATKAELLAHFDDPGAHGIDLIKADLVIVQDDLSAAPTEPVTIPQGVSIVNADRKSRFKELKVIGRSTVNILGREGNGNISVYAWNKLTAALVPDNAIYGPNSVKLTMDSGETLASFFKNVIDRVSQGKYYIAGADVRNGNLSGGIKFRMTMVGDVVTMEYPSYAPSTNYQFQYIKIAPTDYDTATGFVIDPMIEGSGGQYGFISGIRLYEIPQAEYDAIDSMTPEQVAAMYPYVDDMKHVSNIFVQNPGKNLLPPFSEWTLHANTEITESYKMTLFATANLQVSDSPLIACYVGQNYFISANISPGAFILIIDKAKTANILILDSTTPSGTFSATETGFYIRFVNKNGVTGPVSVTNPILNIGSTVLTFEPQKPSYVFLPDCNLRSNVDRSVADRLYMDGEGKPRAVRRFREVVLDGSMGWVFDTDRSGFKVVKVSGVSGVTATPHKVSVKHDGKILRNIAAGSAADCVDTPSTPADTVFISIADPDSGWGDSYTPTTDEIKAYFYGWRLEQEGVQGVPYTSGTKAWVSIVGSEPFLSVTPTRPTINYNPYRLMYELAQSIDEPVTYEGELLLHDGPNQIEMGTGIVVREAANPVNTNGYRIINDSENSPTLIPSRLKNRADRILDIYRNQTIDNIWRKVTDGFSYGKMRALADPAFYDTSAAYSVTYLALDTYKLGIAPALITGAVTPNMKETVDDTVQAITGLRRDVSVLQNVKSDKQLPQWIAPGLLNAWENYGGDSEAAGYYKDSSGRVFVRAFLKNGITTTYTPIFYLPRGYRPSEIIRRTSSSYSSGIQVSSISINPDGSVQCVDNVANTWLILDFSFLPGGGD